MGYTFESLRRENEELKEEVMKLRREVETLREKLSEAGEEVGEQEEVIVRRGRRKGTGSHYDVIRLNRQHRRVLYTLLSQGAVSPETAIPAVQIRRAMKVSQGALAGRIAELIHKNYVRSNQVRVLFQPDSEGSWGWRPESAYDPKIGARRFKRFCYFITEVGKRTLIETAQPSDDFLKALPELETLAELKRALEERQKIQA